MQKHFSLFITILGLGLSLSSKAQPIDFRKTFGEDYTRAEQFFLKNTWITDTLKKYKVPVSFAHAIVFPELIRYSALRDQMEIGGLKILYVSFGNDYADFSIGNFQMKPSFVEGLMLDAEITGLVQIFNPLKTTHTDEEEKRRAIVKSLESLPTQVLYLALFYWICEQKFKNQKWTSEAQKLHFFATAYNCGYRHSFPFIINKQKRKHFSTSIMGDGTKYNYGDIALYFYQAAKVQLTQSNKLTPTIPSQSTRPKTQKSTLNWLTMPLL